MWPFKLVFYNNISFWDHRVRRSLYVSTFSAFKNDFMSTQWASFEATQHCCTTCWTNFSIFYYFLPLWPIFYLPSLTQMGLKEHTMFPIKRNSVWCEFIPSLNRINTAIIFIFFPVNGIGAHLKSPLHFPWPSTFQDRCVILTWKVLLCLNI